MSFTPQLHSRGGASLLLPDRPPQKKRGGSGDFPPINWDDFGGGGGGGGGGDDGEGSGDGPGDEFEDGPGETVTRKRLAAAEFGLRLCLAAVAVLFLSFLGAYVFLAGSAGEWPGAQPAGAPTGLWLSTAILLVSSVCMSTAVRAGRVGADRTLIAWLVAALFSGILFLCVQVQTWHALHSAGLLPSTNGYGAIFYTLTGLHGAHVLAGVAYLAALIVRLRRGNEAQLARSTVRLCGVYWNFIGAVWLVLFCVL